MDKLPLELRQEIFSYCAKSAALDARLVNKAWSETATPYAFRKLTIYPFLFSHQKLQAIAQSGYGKYVRDFYFWTDSLEPLFTDDYGPREISTSLRQAFTLNDGVELWNMFKYHEKQQSILVDNNDHRSAFRTAFCALPNLDRIVMYGLSVASGLEEHIPETGDVMKMHWNSNALAEGMLKLCSDHSSYNYPWIAWVLDAFGQRALSQPSTHVRSFLACEDFAYPTDWTNVISDYSDRSESSHKEAIMTAMGHLHRLWWFDYENFPRPASQLDESEFASLLGSCTQLQELSLVQGRVSELMASRAWQPFECQPLTCVLNTPIKLWHQLRTILLTIEVPAATFLSVLQNCRMLEDLKLLHCGFDDIYPVLKFIPRLKLRHINCEMLRTIDKNSKVVFCFYPSMSREEEYWLLTGEGKEPEWKTEPHTDDTDIYMRNHHDRARKLLITKD